MATTVLKHEFVENKCAGVTSVAELTFDNISVMEGLNKMFRVKPDEQIAAIEIVDRSNQRGTHQCSIKAHIVKKGKEE